jgi:nickel/cobalt transporter (NiCoT) family protein
MSRIFPRSFRSRALGFSGLLLSFNIGAWIWAVLLFRDKPFLLGTAFLAYTFGLRHAVDADHIAAIDNVTRKLIYRGKCPMSVGFFFSLGHATIVVLASLIVYATAYAVEGGTGALKETAGLMGTSVSAFFLILIAVINIVTLRGTWSAITRARNGVDYPEEDAETMLAGGILGRILRPLFRMLSSPWHMYPVGLLFGLGFDTASEIAILGISAAAAAKSLSLGAMAVFPVLFTAGMTLIDTIDGMLMAGAYGWAFVKPVRKLYYNFTITFISVAVALLIGGIEAIGVLKDRFNFSGGLWNVIEVLNNNLGVFGFAIIGVFVLCWLGSLIMHRAKDPDRLERLGRNETSGVLSRD